MTNILVANVKGRGGENGVDRSNNSCQVLHSKTGHEYRQCRQSESRDDFRDDTKSLVWFQARAGQHQRDPGKGASRPFKLAVPWNQPAIKNENSCRAVACLTEPGNNIH